MTINTYIPESKLKNRCFHTFKNGELNYQGKVLEVHDGYIIAQLYEWFMGEPNGTRKFTFDEFKTRDFVFYRNNQEMKEAYDSIFAPEDKRTKELLN